jgi:hypothetical protein
VSSELRPELDPALGELVGALARAAPDALGHLDPARILFVAGAARREARASIRPFGRSTDPRWIKPEVIVGGAQIAYEICLRPRFFLETAPQERLVTIVHELLHIHPRFDGTLDPKRSHRGAPPRAFDGEVRAIAERIGEVECLGWRGELRMRAWTSRPPSRIPAGTRIRARYDDRDLHLAIVEQRGG